MLLLQAASPKSFFKIRNIVLRAMFISQDKIFCTRPGFLRILSYYCFVRLFGTNTTWTARYFSVTNRESFIVPINSSVHKNFNNRLGIQNGFLKIVFGSISTLYNAITAVLFIIPLHFFNITKYLKIYWRENKKKPLYNIIQMTDSKFDFFLILSVLMARLTD